MRTNEDDVLELCLPCRLLGEDMHGDEGVAIKRRAITGYAGALVQLLQGLDARMGHGNPPQPR